MKTLKRLGLISVLSLAGTVAHAADFSDAGNLTAMPANLVYTEADTAEVQFVHRRSFRHSHRRGFRSRGFSHSRRFNNRGYYYGPRYYRRGFHGSRFGFRRGYRYGYRGYNRGFSRFGHGFH